MPSYDWIDIQTPQDYDRLDGVIDAEFNPKNIASYLKSQVTTTAKGLLVEHGYVDKDYRSTFYNFYAKKGRQYRADCVRLHFFDGTIRYDEDRADLACDDGRPQDHYFGYIVLRPTIVASLGRSVLSPRIRQGAGGWVIQSVSNVNLLGHQLPVWGFPSMAQHIDIAVCAHVACWAILRFYSDTFPQYREHLVHDITQLVAPFDPGGLVPSLGLNVLEAERVFQAAGCFPLIVVKPASSSEAFYSQMLAYLESGFPLFVEIPSREHAVVIVGLNWKQSASSSSLPQASSSHVWTEIETLLSVDDNLLPYATVQLHSPSNQAGEPRYSVDSITSFIVALPDKIYYPADAVEILSNRIRSYFARARQPNQEPLELRRYFITTVSKLREYAREHHSQLGDSLVRLMMRLETAQYVWVIEYCSVAQWQSGHVAVRAFVDATASKTDAVPYWLLHDENIAIIYDRSSAESSRKSIRLDRTNLAPLPRIEVNLRHV